MSPEAPEYTSVTGPALVSVDGRDYPLRSADVRARAEGGLAMTTIAQEFENPYAEALEVIYTMPLPADGAVLGYRIRMGDRTVHGEIQKREAAAGAYRRALLEGRTAGLLEEDRADVFTQSLGNVPGRASVTVEIDVMHPVAFQPASAGAGGVAGVARWEYRFPTVVAPRYMSAPGVVPDADRLSPDRGAEDTIPTRVSLDLFLPGVDGTHATASPSHTIEATEAAEGVRVVLAANARLDRDIVVHWRAAGPKVGVRVVEGGGLPGDDGRYALATITPPEVPQISFKRDLTILIDTSGSMTDEPLAVAQRVAEDLLRSLREDDRFEILAFDSKVTRFKKGMTTATDSAIALARRFIRGLDAQGGTEMGEAIVEALRALRANTQRQIVLLSDGQIGFEERVAQSLEGLPAGVRLHVVGIGAAPNRTLTRRLARLGRGAEIFAFDEADATSASGQLIAATAQPVLTEVQISGSAVRGIAPARLRDVFAGQPVVAAAELSPSGGQLFVAGRMAGSADVWGWKMEIAPAVEEGAATSSAVMGRTALPVGALYGRERIADAEVGGPWMHGDLLLTIEALGLRHRVVSRQTSLVAIAEDSSVDPASPRRKERLAVELPYGVSAAGVSLEARGIYKSLGAKSAMPQFHMKKISASLGINMEAIRARLRPARSATPPMELDLAPMAEPGSPLTRAVRVEGVGHVASVERHQVVVELIAPHDGFELDGLLIRWVAPNGCKGDASVSKRHPMQKIYAKGAVIRLTLSIQYADVWIKDKRLTIEMLRTQVGASPASLTHQYVFVLQPGLEAPAS